MIAAQERAAIRAAAQRLVVDWPPLTQEQRDHLAVLLAPIRIPVASSCKAA